MRREHRGIQLDDTVTDFGSVPNRVITADCQPIGRGTLGNWVFRNLSGARVQLQYPVGGESAGPDIAI